MALDPITGGAAVIEAFLVLANTAVKLGMLKIERKNLDGVRDLAQKIAEEDKKEDLADQSLIADLYEQKKIMEEALAKEVLLAMSKGK